jgi:hypothetical protein
VKNAISGKEPLFPATNSLVPASQNDKTVIIDMQKGRPENTPLNEQRFFYGNKPGERGNPDKDTFLLNV